MILEDLSQNETIAKAVKSAVEKTKAEPPRISRRLNIVSHADIAGSASCL